MPATPAEIRNKAARKLGVLAFGQTLSNRYSSDLDAAYNEVYDKLKQLNLVSWTSTGNVPDEVVEPVVSMVAMSRATEYGVSGERYQRLVRDDVNAEIKIRRAIQDPYFNSDEDAVYY